MSLTADIDRLLGEAAREAFGSRTSAPRPLPRPGEVAFLRAFFKSVVPNLEATLNRHAAPLGLSSRVSGIFIHQRPHVSFCAPHAAKRPPTCELGDLLVVVRARSSGPPVDNALLLQGKLGDATWKPSRAGERQQFDLYNQWPQFWWRHRPYWEVSDDKSRRHVEPAAPHAGAQYLMIDVDRNGNTGTPNTRWHAMEARAGAASRPFADVLADVALRLSGRRFCSWSKARGRIGWDRVVWDLIRSAWAPASRDHAWRYENVKKVYRVGLAPPLLTESLSPHVESAWLSLPELSLEGGSKEEPSNEPPTESDHRELPPDEGAERVERYPWGGGGISTVFIDLRAG